METELIQKARDYARETLSGKIFEKHNYHNIEHTQEVVQAAEYIGKESGLNIAELEAVIIAAWLHDIGYADGSSDTEAVAARKSRALLETAGAQRQTIQMVEEAIEATKMPQQPNTLVSKVLCDADLYHLSTNKYEENASKLRQEWRSLGFKDMDDPEWHQFNLQFLESHKYHTTYGQTVLQEGKKKNIKSIRKQLEKSTEKIAPANSDHSEVIRLENEVNKLREKLKKAKEAKPERGIETMFRTTSHNHILLSDMADNKANILITINSIILSIVVSVLIRKLEENQNLVFPTIMLVLVCLTTTVFAILSTRPVVNRGTFTREDIHSKRTNLLFFGNFYGMKLEDYEWGMKEMMQDRDYLYGSLTKDIYYLGKVLGRKYKFLRLAYNIFMYGFVLSILSFLIALAITGKTQL